jgi:VWFA-related protein
MAGYSILIRLEFAAMVWGFPIASLFVPAANGQNPTTIRSSSSLVLVPVSALDKSGHFVPGLGARDFQILVDGKPVEIRSFDAITEGASVRAGSSEAKAAVPPNTFRNISESSFSQPNLVILFIDYLNTRLVDRMGLREGMLKYLATKLKPDQEIAAYGLTYRLVVLQPFTRDPSALIAVAKDLLNQKGQPREPREGTSQGWTLSHTPKGTG